MKILITYSSKTGNTKKVAEAIKSQIPQADIFSVSEIQNMEKIEKYDLIFIGGWIDKGTFDAGALKTAELIRNKKLHIFSHWELILIQIMQEIVLKILTHFLKKIQTKLWEGFSVREQ